MRHAGTPDPIVTILLQKEEGMDALDDHEMTRLISAAFAGHLPVVEALLEAGANVGIRVTQTGCTALHAAVEAGHDGIVVALLAKEANIDALDHRGWTPLMWAARVPIGNRSRSVFETLLAAGADYKIRDSDGRDVLHFAALKEHNGLVSALLCTEADKDSRDDIGETPLIVAARYGHLFIVDALLRAGADFNVHSTAGEENLQTALMAAASGNHLAVVEVLLAAGADCNILSIANGLTALIAAAKEGHMAVVDALLAAGADCNIRSTDFFAEATTALEYAANWGHTRMIEAILEHGAAVNAVEQPGMYTVLHFAALSGRRSAIEVLVEAGANIDAETHTGETPLWVAAVDCNSEAMLSLLQHGAATNVQDELGSTPLMEVCVVSREDTEGNVNLLLGYGADGTAVRNDGSSCADLPHTHRGLSQDEVERIRRLLLEDPADRVWHRRGWLVMLRSRASEALAAFEGGGDLGEDRGVDVAAVMGEAVGLVPRHVGEGHAVDLPAAVMIAIQAGLEREDGLFRGVVGFL